MLGIIGAMDEEVAKLKETMQDVTVETKASMEFYKGTMNGKEVVVVRSGIGRSMRESAHRFCVICIMWML